MIHYRDRITLKEAQQLVRGYVGVYVLPDKRTMLCNENGITERLPLNEEATKLAWSGTEIVGDVVVLPAKNRQFK